MQEGREPTEGKGATSCDLLLTGGVVVTVDDEGTVHDPGAVAITADRIVAVGRSNDLASLRPGRTVDCSGKAVIPGLVDCHNHLFQTLARGLGEGLGGWPWLAEFMWPYAEAITPEETRAAVLLGAIEAVRSGTTAVLDHHYGRTDPATTLGVATAIELVGLRGVVARGIAGALTEIGASQGLPEASFPYDVEEEITFTAACMEARPAGGHVVAWPGPINIVYTDRDLIRGAVGMARSAGVGWHTHCCAPQADPEIFRASHGLRPVEWLYQEDLLGGDTTLAHCTWLDDRDVELIAGTSTGVVYLPISNQYMPYGVMRLRDLRSAGAVVGLGTDGAACGHRQDLFECMKQGVLLQRIHSMAPDEAVAEDALRMATRDGARLLGIEAGVLAPGKLADVVVVDLQRPHLCPLTDPVASLVYSARGSDVVMTLVGGRAVFEGGRCTQVDEAEAMTAAQVHADALTKRAGLTARRGFREPPNPRSADST